jgi:hypothetical protein
MLLCPIGPATNLVSNLFKSPFTNESQGPTIKRESDLIELEVK